jgi:hypothetical protein
MQNSASWASLKHACHSTLFSAQKPKDRRHYIRRCLRHRPPGRASDHHYYRSLPLQEHHRQKQELLWIRYRQPSRASPSSSESSRTIILPLQEHHRQKQELSWIRYRQPSPRASPSSSESSRTIILPSPGGLRMSRLRSPKSFLASFSSREVSTMSEEWSSIGVFLEALPCSNTSE